MLHEVAYCKSNIIIQKLSSKKNALFAAATRVDASYEKDEKGERADETELFPLLGRRWDGNFPVPSLTSVGPLLVMYIPSHLGCTSQIRRLSKQSRNRPMTSQRLEHHQGVNVALRRMKKGLWQLGDNFKAERLPKARTARWLTLTTKLNCMGDILVIALG